MNNVVLILSRLGTQVDLQEDMESFQRSLGPRAVRGVQISDLFLER